MLGPLIWIVLLLFSGAPAQAQPACSMSRADELVLAKRLPEALEEFACVYRRTGDGWALASLGQLELALGDQQLSPRLLRAAEEHLAKALATDDARVNLNRTTLDGLRKKAALRTGELDVRANVEGAKLYLGGQLRATLPAPPLTLDIGNIEVAVEAKGYERVQYTLKIFPKDPDDLKYSPTLLRVDLRYSLVKKWWFWTALGGGIAALGVGLGVGLSERFKEHPDPIYPFPK